MDLIGWVVGALVIEFALGIVFGQVVFKRKAAAKYKWMGRRVEESATSKWQGSRALGE